MINKGMSLFIQCYIAILILFLSGCSSRKVPTESTQTKTQSAHSAVPSETRSKVSVPELPALNGLEDNPSAPSVKQNNARKPSLKPTPPPQPVMHDYAWEKVIASLATGVKPSGEQVPAGLLISQVGNKTNGVINQQHATATLIDIFSKRSDFHVMTEKNKVAGNNKEPGNDILQSKGKALSIARSLGAEYLLYGWVSGNVDRAVLNVHLIEVNTGLLDYNGKKSLSNIKAVRP